MYIRTYIHIHIYRSLNKGVHARNDREYDSDEDYNDEDNERIVYRPPSAKAKRSSYQGHFVFVDRYIYLKTVFAELQSKISFLARNKIYIVKVYNDTRDTNV
jgi:hypothetical protein